MAVCLGSMAGTLGSIGHSVLQLSKPGMRALCVMDELCHSFYGAAQQHGRGNKDERFRENSKKDGKLFSNMRIQHT